MASKTIIYTAAVLLFLGGAGAWFVLRHSASSNPDSPLTAEAKAYVRNLKLGEVSMKATESYVGQTVTEIEGKITNSGDRAVKHADVFCIFYNAYGEVVIRERVPIVTGVAQAGRNPRVPPALRRHSSGLEQPDAATGDRAYRICLMARILVVEDDPDQLEMRKLILEHAGYEVVAAQTGPQAIDNLPGCQVVVMDLRMPSAEDGLRLIQAASGSAKIIVLSGGDVEASLPVDEFLTKPCSSKRLLETIARFCVLLISLCAIAHAGTFTVSKASEVVAELDMRAVGTDWAEEGREAALATLLVDGTEQQQVMLYAGSDQFTYGVFLGKLKAGVHRLDFSGQGVELIDARFREDSSDVIANAPILYARANTIGKYTDIPLLVYCERLSDNGISFLQYTVIFSNEDGGTSTRALMARWGRTTDVEYVYRAFLSPDGSVRKATIQGEHHKEMEFTGGRDGSHPVLMPVTDNNMVGQVDAPTAVRYQIAPIVVDLAGHSREEVMDQHPITYKVMAKELKREGKLRQFGTIDEEKVSDPRNYLYFEMQLARSESSVATLVRLKGGSRWYSSNLGHADFAIRTWKRNAAESPGGLVRTTVELPPGTTAEKIAEIGFECLVPEKASDSTCRVEAVTKCFFLDRDYTPDTNVWTMTAPRDIPPGAIWTSALK